MIGKAHRFLVMGRRMLLVSGCAVPGNYEVFDVFDEYKLAVRYRNRLDSQESRRRKFGEVADTCDVRIFETTERL